MVAVSLDRKSTRLNSSHGYISYAVFCLKKKTKTQVDVTRGGHVRHLGLAPESLGGLSECCPGCGWGFSFYPTYVVRLSVLFFFKRSAPPPIPPLSPHPPFPS